MSNVQVAAVLGLSEPQESLNAWKIAKARFQEGLNAEERALFENATIENIFYSASNVQRKDESSSKSRSAVEKMRPLLGALEDYGKALDTYTQISPLYLAPIWGSIRVVLALTSLHGKFYNRIIDTFARIGEVLPRLRDYERIFDADTHHRFTQALSNVYLDIITLCTEFKALLQAQSNSTVKRLWKPLSPSLNSSFEDAVLRFKQHRKTVDKEAQVCHMIEEKKSRDLVLRNKVLEDMRIRKAKQKDLVSQLSKIDFKYRRRRMQRMRHAGTGTWAASKLEDWLNSDTSAVFSCSGIPGCGKSVLTSSFIDHVTSRGNASTLARIVFFYCDSADKRTLDPLAIFCSITQQLLLGIEELPANIQTSLEDTLHDETTPDLEDVTNLLAEICQYLPEIIVFLDGVDEASERDKNVTFQNLWNMINNAKPNKVKVFVAAREDLSTLTKLPTLPCYRLCLTESDLEADIDSFVQHAVRESIEKGELVLGDAALEREIIKALVTGSKGMFLWVKYQLVDLCECSTNVLIRAALQNLPQSLTETYDRFLNRISGAERRMHVQRMFNWLLCARRPLKVNELREAIAFTSEDDHYDADKLPNSLHRLARSCSNLVIIDDDTQNVQFAHYTVEQYLLQDRPQKSNFHVQERVANLEVGRSCIVYLNFSDFERQVTSYSNGGPTPGQSLAVLGRAIETQTLLPPESSGASIVKVLSRIRRAPLPSSTEIDFSRHVPVRRRTALDELLTVKYALLSYIVENWLYHTIDFEYARDPSHTAEATKLTRCESAFTNLIFHKLVPFNIRPCSIRDFHSQQYPYVLELGWALKENHFALLQSIEVRYRQRWGNTHCNLGEHVDFVAQWVWDYFATKSVKILTKQEIHQMENTFQTTSNPTETWASWLFCCILEASAKDNIKVFRYICVQLDTLDKYDTGTEEKIFYKRRALQFALILLHAAAHSWGTSSTVRYWCQSIKRPDNMQENTIWSIKSMYHGFECNACELAALCGSIYVMKKLMSVGLYPTPLFYNQLMFSTELKEAVTACYIPVVRSLLLALQRNDGDGWQEGNSWKRTDLDRFFYSDQERQNADEIAFCLAVTAMQKGETHFSVPQQLHWIWTTNITAYGKLVDILLLGGCKPGWAEGNWLLEKAIENNDEDRARRLIQAKIPIYAQSLYIDFPESAKIRFKLYEPGIGNQIISLLSLAVLYDRKEIAMLLLNADGLNRYYTISRYSPLHCAVIIGSLELFQMIANRASAEWKAAFIERYDINGFAELHILLTSNVKDFQRVIKKTGLGYKAPNNFRARSLQHGLTDYTRGEEAIMLQRRL